MKLASCEVKVFESAQPINERKEPLIHSMFTCNVDEAFNFDFYQVTGMMAYFLGSLFKVHNLPSLDIELRVAVDNEKRLYHYLFYQKKLIKSKDYDKL